LLAALVIRANQVASTDSLIDAVWGQELPRSPRAAMQNLVSRLRSALHQRPNGADVVTRPRGYCLSLGRDQLDAWRFEDLICEARTLVHCATQDAADRLDQALAWWGGPAYDEFSDEDFVRAEAARLTELKIVAEDLRSQVDLMLLRPEEASRRLEALVAAHPMRETPYAHLMVAHYRAGRTAAALEVYRSYRSRLRDELGADPSAWLMELQTAVLRADESQLDSVISPGLS
jgi:DNA-binding SARP family transcriptional activator